MTITVTLNEVLHPFAFVVSEANGLRSRDNGTVLSGEGVLQSGTVAGKVTASGKLRAWNPANADGSQTVAGIIGMGVDATSADAPVAYLSREAEVNGNVLAYPSGDLAAATTGLAALGIIVR